MKNVLFILCLFLSLSVNLYSQGRPKPIPKDTIAMIPTGELYDTVAVMAVVVNPKEPLTVQEYRLVTKFYTFKTGAKSAGPQWLEKVTEGTVVKIIKDWKPRTLFIMRKEEFLKED